VETVLVLIDHTKGGAVAAMRSGWRAHEPAL